MATTIFTLDLQAQVNLTYSTSLNSLKVTGTPLTPTSTTTSTITGLSLGTWSGATSSSVATVISHVGASLLYTEGSTAAPLMQTNAIAGTGRLAFAINHPTAIWSWTHDVATVGLPTTAMTLNSTGAHELQILPPTGVGGALTLNPTAGALSTIPSNLNVSGNFTVSSPSTATFFGNTTLSGAANEMPNQTLGNNARVLNVGLANGLYLSLSAASSYLTTASATANYLTIANAASTYLAKTDPTLVFGSGSTASGTGTLALGTSASATSGTSTSSIALGRNVAANTNGLWGSIAIGSNVTAGFSSYGGRANAVAIGFSSGAQSNGSVALGYDAWVASENATGAMAIGNGTRVYNEGSTAVGSGVTVAGRWSSALGVGLTVNSQRQHAIGHYNLPDPADNPSFDPNSFPPTQNLFVIGNGQNGSARSNALTVKWNGDTSVTGSLTAAGGITGVGNITTTTGCVSACAGIFSGDIVGQGTANELPQQLIGSPVVPARILTVGLANGLYAPKNGTFTGTVSTTSTISTTSGNLQTQTGDVNAVNANLSGAVNAAGNVASGGDVSGVNATMSGTVTATGDVKSTTGSLSGKDATLTGNVSATNATLSGSVTAAGATVNGNLTTTGCVQACNGSFTGVVRVNAAGGISMGPFTAGPTP